MLSPRVKEHLGNPDARYEKPSLELLVRVVRQTPEMLQAIAIALYFNHIQL